MGAANTRPIVVIGKEEVEAHVRSLGPEFDKYAAMVDDNAIDGELLAEMNDEAFLETLDDLELDHPEHRRKLLEEFQIYSSFRQSAVDSSQGPVAEIHVADSWASLTSQMQGSVGTLLSYPDRATDDHSAHLAPGFYDKIDSIRGARRPPIHKDDMSRTAEAETYHLDDIEPDSDIAEKLVGLVKMAKDLLDMDLGDITFLTNQSQFSLARVGLTEYMTEAIQNGIYEAVNYTADGEPFVCRTDRSIGICNYPTYSKSSFIVPCIDEDEAFKWMKGTWPFQCYIGSPLLSASGIVIGTLCLHNLEPRRNLDDESVAQLEQVAGMIVQSIENWRLRRNITKLETTRKNLKTTKNKTEPPKGKAVVVFAGIEEYETLKILAPDPVVEALIQYMDILQGLRAEYFGFEVSRLGEDGYFMVFHDAVDASGFALELQQQLFETEWSDELLALPRLSDDGCGFRGLRVKIALNMGDVVTEKDPISGKIKYESPKSATIGVARNIFEMTHGGQILTTWDMWNVASFMAEAQLQSPQVVDLGSHVIRKGAKKNEGVTLKRIVQLVPESLAMNYSGEDNENEGSFSEDRIKESCKFGRQFPNLKSLDKLSPSFFDAPGFKDKSESPSVTIAFIGTSEIEKRFKEAATIVSQVIGLAANALRGTEGYQCQNNMLAFPSITSAVQFGLDFSDILKKEEPLADGSKLSSLLTYGCVHDTFITVEPHKTTGRADYFGKVVNRAARVAYTSELGTVCAGVTATPDFNKDDLEINDDTIIVNFEGLRELKGVDGQMAVFKCERSMHA